MTRNTKLFAFGALALLAFAAVPAHARLGVQERGLQGGLLGSVGEGLGKGLGDKLGSLVGGAIAGTCSCAHGYGALGTCKGSSTFAMDSGLQADCTKQSSKGACSGQENIFGKSFCKWTPSKLSSTIDDISKDLDPRNWGKMLGLQRRLESNEVDETNAVGHILEQIANEVGDVTEKMGDEVKDGIENSMDGIENLIREALKGRKLSASGKKCGNAAGEAACISACASVVGMPLCLSDACYGPNGPDFTCGK